MKNFLKCALLILAAGFAAVSCSEDEPEAAPRPEVNYNNISGIWQLTQWHGEALPEGLYFYIELQRKEHTFTIWQNLNSATPEKRTGQYALLSDPYLGDIIRGVYDYAQGDWTHRYIIRDFTHDRMTWVVEGDETDVSVYSRRDAVPDGIKGATEAAL